jgi:hypothetical protein
MSSWINLSAIWKIVVFGLLAGAGLPALFAIGMTSLTRGGRSSRGATATAGTAGPGGGDDVLIGGGVIGMMIAAVCFLIVLAAIGWGIFEIYHSGHPAK